MSNIIEGLFNLVDKITGIYPIVAILVFCLVLLFDRQKLEIKLDGVAKFVAALTLLGAIKICMWDGALAETNPYDISMKNFLFVFLEDAFYVMIPFYLTRIGSRRGNILIWVFFSLIFGVAHRYQGILAIFVTAVYPYFISNRLAAKTSFGTVMACHFLWDCFVLSLPKINNLFCLADKL
jgi:membrane protease YdiL (CAAX protease family)